MPIDVPVRISACTELARFVRTAGLVRSGHTQPGLPAAIDEAVRHVPEFWDDGLIGMVELVYLADRLGRLDDPDPARFVADLADPAVLRPDAGPAGFGADGDELWPTVVERLQRLSSSEQTRDRYRRHLADAWAAIAPWWSEAAPPLFAAAIDELRRRLRAADSWTEALPAGHPAADPAWGMLLAVEQRRGRVVVQPCVVNPRRSYAVDVPGGLLVGIGLNDERTPGEARRLASATLDQIKAVDDPTRLAVLLYLTEHAKGVVQLSDEFGLAPATMSVHLRILREARLVEERREGRRVVYTAAMADVIAAFDRSIERLRGVPPT